MEGLCDAFVSLHTVCFAFAPEFDSEPFYKMLN